MTVLTDEKHAVVIIYRDHHNSTRMNQDITIDS
jgi:hypothetical protein